MNSLVFVFTLLLIGVVTSQTLTWSGTWTSTCDTTTTNSRNCYGGYLSLCTNGTHIYGSYSGIGLINGTTSGRSASGTWIEAGYNDKNKGGFFWQLNDDTTDGVKFTGYYWFDNEECITYTWNGRLYDTEVDSSKCLTIETSTTPSIEGHWQAGVLDAGIDDLWICLDSDYQHYSASSYINPQGYTTYSYGRVFSGNGKIAQGSAFYQFGETSTKAITLYVLTGTDTLVSFIYNTDSVLNAGDSYDTVTNQQITWTRVGKASESSCNSYVDLANIGWGGVWSDSSLGTGRLYTCLTSNSEGTPQVAGVYSEYGWITGTLSEDLMTINGTFYDSGADGTSGQFTLTLASDGNSFSGHYYYSNDSTTLYTWTEERLDVSSAYSDSCWLPSESTTKTAAGSWIVDYYGNILDLCIDGSTFTASYESGYYNTPGYAEGSVYDGGKSLQSTFYEELANYVGIIRYRASGLEISTWEDPIAAVFYEPCNGAIDNPSFNHQVGLLGRSSDAVGNCTRNSYIKSGDFPSSSASMIIPSIFAILLVCFMMF